MCPGVVEMTAGVFAGESRATARYGRCEVSVGSTFESVDFRWRDRRACFPCGRIIGAAALGVAPNKLAQSRPAARGHWGWDSSAGSDSETWSPSGSQTAYGIIKYLVFEQGWGEMGYGQPHIDRLYVAVL